MKNSFEEGEKKLSPESRQKDLSREKREILLIFFCFRNIFLMIAKDGMNTDLEGSFVKQKVSSKEMRNFKKMRDIEWKILQKPEAAMKTDISFQKLTPNNTDKLQRKKMKMPWAITLLNQKFRWIISRHKFLLPFCCECLM